MDGEKLAAKPVPPAAEIIRAPAPQLASTFCFSVCGHSWANGNSLKPIRGDGASTSVSKSQIRQQTEWRKICVWVSECMYIEGEVMSINCVNGDSLQSKTKRQRETK